MMRLDDKFVVLNARHQYITLTHEHDKVIVFERADLLFVFNFHPHKVCDIYIYIYILHVELRALSCRDSVGQHTQDSAEHRQSRFRREAPTAIWGGELVSYN